MGEHQNVEWKESWRDEYLKWICGFANAQGGTLLVGKNDHGKHPSSPYNPLLAGAFFRAGYIESWGRGIEKIRKECLRYGMVAPIYNDGMNGLMVTFRAGKERLAEALGAEIASQLLSNITAEKVGDNGLKVGNNESKVGDNESKVGDNGLKIGSGVGDNGLKVGDEVGDNLNDRQRSILALLQQTPELTVRELALKVDISTRKVEANLAKLKAAGYLVRIGPPKGGYWQVMKAGQIHYSLPTKTLLQIG